MAKGKESLLETTPKDKIVVTDKEEGSIPFFEFDDEYGIAVDQFQYILVQKKISGRTVTDENGNEYVESYIKWDTSKAKYSSTVEGIIDSYISVIEKKKLKDLRTKDMNDIIKVRLEIKAIIEKAFNNTGVNKEILDTANKIQQAIRP